MNKGGRKAALSFAVMAFFSGAAAGAYNAEKPLSLFGSLGYDYRRLGSEGGSKAEGARLLGSLNARSYLWQPWFATAEGGGTVSVNSNNTPTVNSDVNLVSGHFNLNVFPRSRFPFQATYLGTENIVAWDNRNESTFVGDVGEFHSRFLSVRQRYIANDGNYFDGWYSRRLRGTDDFGDLQDDIVGMTIRTRSQYQSFYATGTYQTRERTLINETAKNTTLSLNHNYYPTSDFYINSLATKLKVNNNVDVSNGSFFRSSVSDIGQVSTHFYWRPEYRPYTMTGAARVHQRQVEFLANDSDQLSLSASLAASYRVNLRLRVDGAASFSSLNTKSSSQATADNNSLGTTQSVGVNYQSDSALVRGFTYYWFANGGVGNRILAQYHDRDFAQRLNVGAGHSGQRRWVTGNRSSLRLNLTQTGRQFVGIGGEKTLTNVNNSASVSWQNSLRNGAAFAQLSFLDTRSVGDGFDAQLATLQLSRNQGLSRLSSWGAHVTAQSSRRNLDSSFDRGFITTVVGRLNYRHARFLGVYRLLFLTKLDLSSAANAGAGDRRQAEWESRLAYNVGLLNLASTYRMLRTESGGGSYWFLFQVYRNF